MKQIFADTFYWAASINPGDDWYDKANAITKTLKQVRVVTTEEVLAEVLTFFSTSGIQMRRRAIQLVQRTMANPKIQIIQQTHESFLAGQTHESFLAGVALYGKRLDKEYSLTDCISMNTMRQLGITEILTHDHHFTQEGFIILFRSLEK